MPTLSISQGSIPMTTKSLKKLNQKSKSPLSDSFFELKDLTLISHIDALKRLANDEPLQQNFRSSPSNTSLPVILNVQHSSSNVSVQSEQPSIKHVVNKPAANAWDIDPALVVGNLRQESHPMLGNLALEEILSRSSESHKKAQQQVQDDLPLLDRNVNSNILARRKSSKSAKKKSGRRKTPSSSKTSKDQQVSLQPQPTLEIDALSALCQSVTIHEKTLPVKEYKVKKSKEKQKNNNKASTPSPQSNQSFASRSLNNAIEEYSKRHSFQSHGPIQRKKSKSAADEDFSHTRKVFLSEKQSGVISEGGISYPCAPPATPSTDQMKKYEYVPCLHDIRSQRSFRNRLQVMENKSLIKDKKKEEMSLRQEKLSIREKKLDVKRRQRLEIYALNQVMTELEHKRYLEFMASVGSNV